MYFYIEAVETLYIRLRIYIVHQTTINKSKQKHFENTWRKKTIQLYQFISFMIFHIIDFKNQHIISQLEISHIDY